MVQQKMLQLAVLLGFSLVLTSGCAEDSPAPQRGVSPTPVAQPSLSQFSYKFEVMEKGEICSTGRHELNSKEELCDTLKNHEINNHCAFQVRKQRFTSESCLGDFSDDGRQSPNPNRPDVRRPQPSKPGLPSTIETSRISEDISWGHDSKTKTYYYKITTHRCTTGPQEALEAEICALLRDDAKNKNCGKKARLDLADLMCAPESKKKRNWNY